MADRLLRHVDLSVGEIGFLESLAARPFRFDRGQIIQSAGEPAQQAFVLIDGWAMTFTDFANGSRQIRRLHFPGDLLAMPSMAMARHVENIEAITDVVVAPFQRDLLAQVFREHPRLAAIQFMFAQEERITYGDRLSAVGRLCAKARIAFLLMDVLTRLRAADPSIGCAFEMHLTRGQMSEVTGMTPVHASRMWSELIAEGSVSCEKRIVTIHDEARLVALSGFANRATDLDFSWLPS